MPKELDWKVGAWLLLVGVLALGMRLTDEPKPASPSATMEVVFSSSDDGRMLLTLPDPETGRNETVTLVKTGPRGRTRTIVIKPTEPIQLDPVTHIIRIPGDYDL